MAEGSHRCPAASPRADGGPAPTSPRGRCGRCCILFPLRPRLCPRLTAASQSNGYRITGARELAGPPPPGTGWPATAGDARAHSALMAIAGCSPAATADGTCDADAKGIIAASKKLSEEAVAMGDIESLGSV